jgi:membrane-associated phospholipid phosphatase
LRPGASQLGLVGPAVLALAAGCARDSLLGVESADRAYWRGYLDDTRDLFTRPARWEGRDWLAFTGLAAGVIAVGSQDEPIRRSVLDSRTSTTEDLAWAGEKAGALRVLVPGVILGYGLGAAADDARLKEACLLGGEALALSTVTVRVIKHLVGRSRPYNEEGPDEFIGPSIDGDRDGWPSGHTTVAFAVATAFHLEYRRPLVTALVYSLAALAAWSRVHDDMHWASDVVAGAAIGTVISRGVFRARAERAAGGEGPPSARAVVAPGFAGVVLRF